MYVGDCISGKNSKVEAMNRIEEIEVVFDLRGINFSHEDPPKLLSYDGWSMRVADKKRYSKRTNFHYTGRTSLLRRKKEEKDSNRH